MNNNFFSIWKILCEKERLKAESESRLAALEQEPRIKAQQSSDKRAIIDASRAADCPKAFPALSAPKILLTISFLTDEQVMRYLVTEKIK